MVAAEVAGDGVPVEQLGMQRSIVPASECFGQHPFCPDVRSVAGLFQARVGLTKGEDVEEIIRRGRIDVTALLVEAVVEDDHRRQPDDVQRPHVGITKIETQRNECRVNSGDDGRMWIHHGIQQLAADSVVLFDVD